MSTLAYSLTLNASAFRSALAASSASVRAAATAMGSGFSAISGAMRGLQNTAAGLVSSMHQINGAVELVGKTAGGLKSLMEEALGPAARMEQTRVAFETLTGGAENAKRVLGEMKSLAASTPFEFPDLAEAGKKLIAFGEPLGSVTDNLRRIGDLASGVGAPIGELAEIFGKARVQNQLFAEDINQLTGRGIPVIQQFAKIMGVSTDQVKKLAEQGKITFPLLDQAFRNLTGSGGQFNGMMEKQAGTWIGLTSTLADAWTEVKTSFGEPILESLKPLLTSAISLVENMKESARGVGQSIGEWVNYIRGAVEAGVGWEALTADLKVMFLKVADYLGLQLNRALWVFTAGMEAAIAKAKSALNPFGDYSVNIPAEPTTGPFAKELGDAEARRSQIKKLSDAALEQSAMKSKMAKEGKELMDALTAGLRWGLAEDDSIAPGVAEAVAGSKESAEKEAKEVGRAVGKGITWGISSKKRDIQTEMQDAQRLILNGIKAAQQALGGNGNGGGGGGGRTAGGRQNRNPALDAREAAAERRAFREARRAQRKAEKDAAGPPPMFPMLDKIPRDIERKMRSHGPGLPDKPGEKAEQYLKSIDSLLREKFPDLGVL